jgi:hypothetical protein
MQDALHRQITAHEADKVHYIRPDIDWYRFLVLYRRVNHGEETR